MATIHLPTSGCGIKLNSKEDDRRMYFAMMLVVQQDRHLRQITDQERLVKCELDGATFALKSASMTEDLKRELMKMNKDVASRLVTFLPQKNETANQVFCLISYVQI